MRPLNLLIPLVAAIVLISCGPKAPPEIAASPTAEPSPAAPAALPAADDLFRANVEALGGASAYEGYENWVTRASLSVIEQGLTMEMEVRMVTPDQIRTELTMPGVGVILSGYDGERAWELNPMTGPRLKSGPELSQARRQADYAAALHFEAHYPTRETVERLEFAGEEAWRVAVTTPEGHEESIYFSTESGLQIGMESVVESDMGALPVTTVMSDFDDSDGLLMPRRLTQSMGPITMETVITGITFNVEPSPDVSPPAEIQALIAAQLEAEGAAE